VVALYQDCVIYPFEVLSPLLHRLHDCNEFLNIRVVALFGMGVFSIVEIDWSKSSEPVIIIKDAGDCEAGCIGLEISWLC